MKFTLLSHQAEVSLDQMLCDHLKEQFPDRSDFFSKNRIKSWRKQGEIQLGEKRVYDLIYLNEGEHSVEVPNWETLTQQNASASENPHLAPLVFDSESFFVLNKPPGTPTQPLRSDETETVVGSALHEFSEIQGVGTHPLEPGLLHRLDVKTSGAVLFAKTQDTFLELRSKWNEITKIYRSICEITDPGSFEKIQNALPYEIDLPLAHRKGSQKKMFVADTDFKQKKSVKGDVISAKTWILKANPVEIENRHCVDLEIKILTGARHQIRAHLGAVGLPILGDELYHPAPRGDRLFLHAWKLLLSQDKEEITAPLPRDWAK